jgi:predicted nucleic acid-binding protein
MIALDTNILVYAISRHAAFHKQSLNWLNGNTDILATSTINVAETLNILSNPRMASNALTMPQALAYANNLIDTYDIQILVETPRWWDDLPPILEQQPGLKGNEIHDARIALCCKHHGIKEICTFDADFMKYRFLKVITPQNP